MSENNVLKKSLVEFKLCQISEDIEEGSALYQEISELLKRATCIDDLINSWMDRSRTRELTFADGPSELNEDGSQALFVVLEEADHELAVAEFKREELGSGFVTMDVEAFKRSEEDDSDSPWFELRDQKYGIHFDDLFCEQQIPRGSVQQFISTYLSSPMPSIIRLFFVDDDSLNQIESEVRDEDENYSISRNYVCMAIEVECKEQSDESFASEELISFFL